MLDLWQGWLGVSITYVILAALLALVLSNSKVHVVIRMLVIPIVIWWSFALFYGSRGLRGHAIEGYPPPGSIIATGEIVEDSPTGEPGGIYLIAFLPHKSRLEVKVHPLDPRHIFLIFKEGVPVYYKIPYTRERHKEIMKKLKEAQKKGGRLRMKRGEGEGKWMEKDKPAFEIINPQEILSKPEYLN